MNRYDKFTFVPDDKSKPVIKPKEETPLQKFAKKLLGPSAESAQASELEKELEKDKVKRGL